MKQKTQPRNKLFYVGMAIGFVLAFAILWLAMPYIKDVSEKYGGGVRAAAERSKQIEQKGLNAFVAAMSRSDFPAMKKTGEEVFIKGRLWPGGKEQLAEYEINSMPPYRVYALYTNNTRDKTQRVLLTLDEDEKIVSFLAEEMPVL